MLVRFMKAFEHLFRCAIAKTRWYRHSSGSFLQSLDKTKDLMTPEFAHGQVLRFNTVE